MKARSLSGREAADLYRIRDLPKRISVLRETYEIKGTNYTDLLGQRYMRYTYVGRKDRPVAATRQMVAA